MHSFYVDDCLASVASEAVALYGLQAICARGGSGKGSEIIGSELRCASCLKSFRCAMVCSVGCISIQDNYSRSTLDS